MEPEDENECLCSERVFLFFLKILENSGIFLKHLEMFGNFPEVFGNFWSLWKLLKNFEFFGFALNRFEAFGIPLNPGKTSKIISSFFNPFGFFRRPHN